VILLQGASLVNLDCFIHDFLESCLALQKLLVVVGLDAAGFT
jgi:hypothetical protein